MCINSCHTVAALSDKESACIITGGAARADKPGKTLGEIVMAAIAAHPAGTTETSANRLKDCCR